MEGDRRGTHWGTGAAQKRTLRGTGGGHRGQPGGMGVTVGAVTSTNLPV